MAHLGQCAHQVPGAAWTWERHKMHAQMSLCPCGVPRNLSSLDLGSARKGRPTLDSTPAEDPGA